MFVTLLIAGEDKGQMRPGLATALASGADVVVLKRHWGMDAPQPAVIPAVMAAEPAAKAVIENASYTPEPAVVEASRRLTPEPVFTLSALPEVAVDTTTSEPVAEPATAAESAGGEIWYVAAKSVNVRQDPSTDSAVIEKLSRGEAVSVAFEPGSEWAQVTIEGDGLQGYVALRLLAPEAP